MKCIRGIFVLAVIPATLVLSLTPDKNPRRLITIMLDPAGDAKNTGRLIEDTFERGLTLSFAQELKKRLEREHTMTRIILTRFPGETLEPLQNALFANTLGVNFYLTLLFFWQRDGRPSSAYLYYCMYHPVTDFWHQASDELTMYPYNKAYLFNLQSSYEYGTTFYQQLQTLSMAYNYEMKAFLGAPLIPLVGIIAPCVALEIGLQDKDDWHRFIEPVCQALSPIINNLKAEVS